MPQHPEQLQQEQEQDILLEEGQGPDGIDLILAEEEQRQPATSQESDIRPSLEEQVFMAEPDQEELGTGMMDENIENALSSLYGSDFPLLGEDQEEEAWVSWGRHLWDRHEGNTTKRLHLVQRNRLFRDGIQWISSSGGASWREPPKPRDAARAVQNMIAPALNQRSQITSEQRPGFRTRPATEDNDDKKKAEAQQIALEYQWDQQEMMDITREAMWHNGTDGVVFLEIYWDPDAGPWHEAFGVDEQGQEQAMGPDGNPAQPGPEGQPGQPHKFQLGDIKTRVRKIDQIRVSADATSTIRPWYVVLKDTLSKAEAIREYGPEVADAPDETDGHHGSDTFVPLQPRSKSGYLLPDTDELMHEHETVERYTVYCEKSEFLPKGLTLITVGDKMVFQGPLLVGRIPIVRWADGSSDPAYFNAAQMELWVDSQMRVNAVLSKWIENIRLNAGPRLIAKTNALSGETLVGGTTSVIEARGLGPLNDLVRPMQGFSLSGDAKELMDLEVRNFENLTGWNDTSRGQFSAQQSGRAILAIREQLERIFAPGVMAAARAMTHWAEISLLFMKWGYDIPRTVSVEGKGRPDLARALVTDDFDKVADVFIDPETLMPMPRALRLNLLNDWFDKGLISPAELRRRSPFASLRDLDSPDQTHEARARRSVEMMKQGQWLPIVWMDNEEIHKEILEREVLLTDDQPPEVQAMAFERWMQLFQQGLMKMQFGGIPPGLAPPAPPSGGSSSGGAANPATQPLAGTNPSVASGTFSTLGGETDANAQGVSFDQRTPG